MYGMYEHAIILPRQARDKHTSGKHSTNINAFFLRTSRTRSSALRRAGCLCSILKTVPMDCSGTGWTRRQCGKRLFWEI
eukprot:COSAG06_NODE_2534_length_6710_cov_23.487521_7_plen_79_part_00